MITPSVTTVKEVASWAKVAPQWACVVLIVGLFIWHLHSEEGHVDRVASARIAICHEVQHEASLAMRELASSMEKQRLTFADMVESNEDLLAQIQKYLDKVEKE